MSTSKLFINICSLTLRLGYACSKLYYEYSMDVSHTLFWHFLAPNWREIKKYIFLVLISALGKFLKCRQVKKYSVHILKTIYWDIFATCWIYLKLEKVFKNRTDKNFSIKNWNFSKCCRLCIYHVESFLFQQAEYKHYFNLYKITFCN